MALHWSVGRCRERRHVSALLLLVGTIAAILSQITSTFTMLPLPASSTRGSSASSSTRMSSPIQLAAEAPQSVQDLEPGMKLTGTITGIRDFGAFVDVGLENDGMVHISRILENERVEDIYSAVEEGQSVDVWVTDVKYDGKFGLAMYESSGGGGRSRGGRAAQADLTPFAQLDSQEWFTGVVASVAPFGAFVDLTLESGETARGLVHVSKVQDGYLEDIYSAVDQGQEVKVRITNVDTDEGKMSLSMLEDTGSDVRSGVPSRSDVEAFTDVQEKVKGTVLRIAPFGAFVEVTHPTTGATAQGLLHISQMSEDHVDSVEDIVQIGQEIEVSITEVDALQGRIGLSLKEQ